MSAKRPSPTVSDLLDIVSSSSLAASPHVALEQISCLIMIKYLEFSGHDTSWSALLKDTDPAQRLSKIAFPNLREAERLIALNGHFTDAYFQLEAAKPEALKALLKAVNDTFDFDQRQPFDASANLDAFDTLLSSASVGGNSLDTTPRRVSRLMVSLLDPKPGQSLIDPAAGTARLLVYADRYRGTGRAQLNKASAGIEVDKSVARIAWVNLLLNQLDTTQMNYGDSVASIQDMQVGLETLQREHYDFVLSDLPHGNVHDDCHPEKAGYLPAAAFGDNERLTRRLEILSIWRSLDLLKIKGRAALLVPQSVLYGITRAHRKLRRELLCSHVIEGIILLPHASAPKAILLFAKSPPAGPADKPRTLNVWFYEVGNEIGENGYGDLYDALAHFRARRAAENLPLERGIYHVPLPPTTDNAKAYPVGSVKHLDAINMEGGRTRRHPILLSRTASTQIKQWQVPVRDWVQKPDWKNRRGQVVGSHDEHNQVRPDYEGAAQRELYIDGELQPGLLTRNCIEARNWTLDINEYRLPLASAVAKGESTAQLIDELREVEQDILNRLERLRALLGEAQ